MPAVINIVKKNRFFNDYPPKGKSPYNLRDIVIDQKENGGGLLLWRFRRVLGSVWGPESKLSTPSAPRSPAIAMAGASYCSKMPYGENASLKSGRKSREQCSCCSLHILRLLRVPKILTIRTFSSFGTGTTMNTFRVSPINPYT